MTDYYISSLNGSDTNTGASQDAAWQSLSMLDKVKLEPGDTVYLEAGSEFNDALWIVDDYGTEENPIRVTSYGEGDAPLLTYDRGSAIIAARSSHVIVENIEIGQTMNAGIVGWDSDFWTIQNVTFDGAGGTKNKYGSISWKNSHDLVIENNDILNSYGDGVFLNNMDSVVVSNNFFSGVNGSDADNVQVIGTNVIIENNVMLISEDTTSNKGNIVLHGENFYVADNYLEGGSYGVSASADYVVIEGNTIKDHDTYSWSMGLGFTDEYTGDVLEGLVIRDNDFSDAPTGISFYGAIETQNSSDIMNVTGMSIEGNYFHDWYDKAVKFTNLDVEGDYSNNTFYQAYDPYWSNSYANSTYDLLTQESNMFVDQTLPTIALKTVTITASGALYDGAPIMHVYQNGELVYEVEVWADKSLGERDDYSFELSEYSESDKIEIMFVNDKYNRYTKEDRNLYLHDIKIDGEKVSFWDASFSGKAYTNKSRSYIKFSAKGTVSFSGDEMHLQPEETVNLDIRDILDLDGFLAELAGSGETVGTVDPQELSMVPDFGYVQETFEQLLTDVL